MRGLFSRPQVQHADDRGAEHQPEQARPRRADQPFPGAGAGPSAGDAMREIVETVAEPADMERVEAMKENLPANPQHRRGAEGCEPGEQPGHEGDEPAPASLPRPRRSEE